MGVNIQFSQSYFWLDTWVLANIMQLATQDFCDRFIDYRLDPGRRLYDQITMAARSGVANIAEGSSRHSTSIETELRLLDVARGSFNEMQGDIFNYLLRMRAEVWAMENPARVAVWQMRLDEPQYGNDHLHEAAKHILAQKSKFDPWLANANPAVIANALLVLCEREQKMLTAQMRRQLDSFKETGGFSENMTAERLEARRALAASEGAPKCPLCGKTMIKRTQKRGAGQGTEFWGCSDYPKCTGARRKD